jgi:hypothetical protein
MKHIKLHFAKYILLTAIMVLVIFKLYNLSKINFEIDELAKELAPFQRSILPGSSIGFYTDHDLPGLYMAVEYVMAPKIILNRSNTDTLILVQSKANPVKLNWHYRTIARNEDDGKIMSLIARVK